MSTLNYTKDINIRLNNLINLNNFLCIDISLPIKPKLQHFQSHAPIISLAKQIRKAMGSKSKIFVHEKL